jgi:nucleotidyltransferase/DNA polymerase involved in DNA repair
MSIRKRMWSRCARGTSPDETDFAGVYCSCRDDDTEFRVMARIDEVAGVGQKDATKLRKAGVKTSGGLIDLAATRRGRTELSSKTGIPPRELQAWVHHADLLRVKGVGGEYAELLVAAGVETVRDLRRRNPTALVAKILSMNGSDKVVKRLPTESMVTGWIDSAKSVEPSLS